jgi:hypothetical protein
MEIIDQRRRLIARPHTSSRGKSSKSWRYLEVQREIDPAMVVPLISRYTTCFLFSNQIRELLKMLSRVTS